jgi:hypothetical protein
VGGKGSGSREGAGFRENVLEEMDYPNIVLLLFVLLAHVFETSLIFPGIPSTTLGFRL